MSSNIAPLIGDTFPAGLRSVKAESPTNQKSTICSANTPILFVATCDGGDALEVGRVSVRRLLTEEPLSTVVHLMAFRPSKGGPTGSHGNLPAVHRCEINGESRGSPFCPAMDWLSHDTLGVYSSGFRTNMSKPIFFEHRSNLSIKCGISLRCMHQAQVLLMGGE